MALNADHSLSVSEASSRGVSALLRDAEAGHDAIVERHGKPIAAIVGMQQLVRLHELEADLRSATLVLIRLATDDGRRISLDDLIVQLGFDRADLESVLAADADRR